MLTDEEEEGDIFIIIYFRDGFGNGAFGGAGYVSAVFHDGNFAPKTVVAKNRRGTVIDCPDSVTFVEEIDDDVDDGFRDGFGVGDFEGVIVEFAMESSDERDVEFFGDAQSFGASGKGAVGVNDVERDGFELFVIFMADPRDADAVKLGRDFEAGRENSVKRISAFCVGMVRGDVIDGVTEFFEFFTVSESDSPNAIEVWRKGITKLPDNHYASFDYSID